MPGVNDGAERAKRALATRWRCDAGDYVVAAAVDPRGRYCVLGLGNGEVVALDLESGHEVFRHHAHVGSVLSVGICADGERIASSGQDASARMWGRDGELLCELPGGAGWVEQVVWDPLGARLATAAGRTVRVWDRSGAPVLETAPMASTATGVAWHPDASSLAMTCYGGVYIWPVVPGATPRHLQWKGSLISLAWSPNGKVIASGSQDKSVHFWRLANGKDSEMTGYAFKPRALAWDSDSTMLATAGDAAVTVWDFRGQGPERTKPIQLEAHRGECTCLSFAPRKAVLASGSQDTSVLIWEPRRSNKVSAFGFLEDEVTAVVWVPGGRELLAADASGNVIAWGLV
ncbi:MAG: WD40 repeat domain-containing protein [Deltaproteobacteria bacterium]|nr:WD40 repeat domain-containing protein [Nannocystaceae bacterium]